MVGIGASAGGLAAYKAFFSHMPGTSGMAFVLVPHLDPTHQSLMVELLAQQTAMPVCEAQENMPVKANHVYIIPPAKYITIQGASLHLSTPPRSQKVETAIDHFLSSLALDQQQRAIGIILSGTSSHGTAGLQAIKAAGGMAMVQTPASAEYDSMPQNAIDSGVVDFILPPAEMPAVLINYVQHIYVRGNWSANEQVETEHEQLDRVLTLLRVHTQYDFRHYRKNMIKRRVLRRMGLKHITHLGDYSELLSRDPQEAKQLFRDLLISVTGFFREPEAYKVLEQRVIPQWIARVDKDDAVRIWVPGCATGEEAYSLAILLIEQFSVAQQPLKLQIFATDIDEVALDIARQGIYPVSIAADVSAQRLARFFNQVGSHYQVSKQVRDSVVFATQNLISDAPFSKLDLISCRNLLIYLEAHLQQKVISLFHFALNQGGFLFLGSSETVGRHLDLFETVAKKWRIFRRIGLTRRDIVEFPITSQVDTRGQLLPAVKPFTRREMNFAEITQRQLLNDYAPASVLINRKFEVLFFQGATGDFLEAPTGEPTQDLIAMARQGLQGKLRAACYRSIRDEKPVIDSNMRVLRNHSWHPCTITVKPILDPKQAEGLFLVTFQLREVQKSSAQGGVIENLPAEESSLLSQLEYELKVTREDLQNTIEDMNSSNEELKASNEEIMSMNEELQSANEELETSKEELQSLNEELTTVNNQLQDKVEELDKSHNDMRNLLNSSEIATLFLDTSLTIRQFTPCTGKLLGLLESDRGRPIHTFATEFTAANLQQDAGRVLDTLTPKETMLETRDGHYYLRRILPYRTADNHIDGLVVTFVDITQRVQADDQARRMATVLRDSNDAITVFDLNGHITAWNRGAEQLYGYTEGEALELSLSDIVPSARLSAMHNYFQRITSGEQFKSFDSSRMSKDGHIIPVWITLTPLYDESGKPNAIVSTERDISERLQLDVLRVQTDRLATMVEHLPAGAVYLEQKDHLFLNRAAEEITGYAREELQTLDQWFSLLYGEKSSRLRELYEKQRAENFPEPYGPIELIRKNGELRYIEYAAYRSDKQEVWILHDVTQRHQAEIALRDREDRLSAVMESAAEAIVVIDRYGVITDFNNAAQIMFGYSANEAKGRNVSHLMPSPHRELHDGYLEHYMKTGEPNIMKSSRQLPGCRKDGSIFPLMLTVTEVDHLGVFVGIIRDLSNQKILEKQVADISTQEQERIGLEIHDGLGQQLTGLSLLASSIKNRLAQRNQPEVESMNELIGYLHEAISDARSLSRGLVPVPVTPEGLSDALKMLMEDIQFRTRIRGHFKTHQLVEIRDRTNAMQIYRIAQEAVNNAVKHAKPANITIELDGRDEHFQMTIKDDGSGFDPHATRYEGIGISIMRYRASIIGCNLSIDSTPGKGTVVSCNKDFQLAF